MRQLPSRPITIGYALPALQPMFKTNVGVSGLAFPSKHPYFKDLPQSVLSFGDANFKKDNLRPGKGSVYESGMAKNEKKIAKDRRYISEYFQRTEVADALANHFNTDVFINPEFQVARKDWRYNHFYAKAPIPGKQPDFNMAGKFWEMESYERRFKFG
jgi:hypothetical protein